MLISYLRQHLHQTLITVAQLFNIKNRNTTSHCQISVSTFERVGRDSSVGIATRCKLEGPGI
jgi:hypothetical protein